MKRAITIIALVLSFGLMQSASAQIQAITGTPKLVTATSVEAFATVTPDDLSGIAVFRLWDNANNCQFFPQGVSGSILTPITASITGLDPNTVYSYDVIVYNGSMTDSAVGNLISFQTPQATGFTEVSNVSNLVLIYPNPTKDVLNIALKSPGITSCEVYDLTGSKVLSITLTNGISTTLDVSTLKNGTYVLQTTQSESLEHHTQRFIVLR